MNKRVILLILDGWGNGKPYDGNAINLAQKPNFDSLIAKYPNSELHTCGEWVGLPDGQMGNSEVGHMNIGAGRVVYQQLVLINKAFRENLVKDNEVLKSAFHTIRGRPILQRKIRQTSSDFVRIRRAPSVVMHAKRLPPIAISGSHAPQD
jgi:bisphosphoglycerate-independent phosphoglycerate mutase (AlkP superfamily)